MKLKYLIYGLIDTGSHELRYIGRSSSGFKRPRSHWSACRLKEDNFKARWLRKLIATGLEPEIVVLEEFESPDFLNEAEQKWIAAARNAGCRLTNTTDGGDGIVGHRHSDETKAKMSASQRGKKHSEETKQKLAEIARQQDKTALQQGRETFWSDEIKKTEWIVRAKERTNTPEAKARSSMGGHRAHELSGEKCLAALWTPEARVKRAAGQKLRFSDPDVRIKASRKMGGRPIVDSNGVRYETMKEAADKTGAARANIQAVLRGARKQALGLTFRYAYVP